MGRSLAGLLSAAGLRLWLDVLGGAYGPRIAEPSSSTRSTMGVPKWLLPAEIR